MNESPAGIHRSVAQLDEYLRVSRMLLQVLAANGRSARVVEKRIGFGSHPQQFVVLHYGLEMVGQRKPIIYFLHGGGWGHGNAGLFRFVGRFFAQAGYPAIMG
ncbi:MAG: hypothetical protein ACM3QS_02420, partial [Bacteroidota bacterium]